jgi:hypothetical protein
MKSRTKKTFSQVDLDQMNNRYETKMAVKEGACDLCYRATQSVLTCGPADFFFICKNHLLSPLFCKPEVDPSPPASSTPLPEKVEDEKKDSRDEASSKDAERANYTPAPELPPPRWYILDAKIYGQFTPEADLK